jgi:hypothetical protein
MRLPIRRVTQKATLVALAILGLSSPGDAQIRKPSYATYPNHVEIVDRALELAGSAGFSDPSLSLDEIRARLACGVYDEDFALMPGTVGEHYPSPWTKGPDFSFGGLLPVTKIPYGVLTDPWSGWYRGLSHGFDPVTGYTWPGAMASTVDWANSPANTFSWNNALLLYAKGQRAEAYECLGHVLHLLMDLSVPAHVMVVNHGAVYTKRNSGYPWDPDVVSITLDEYETAINGGLESNLVQVIPDLHGFLVNALARAESARIPRNDSCAGYLRSLALLTRGNPFVTTYYGSPAAQGMFGYYRNEAGGPANTGQLGSIAGPGLIGDRYTQVAIYSTASGASGTVVPHQVLEAICDSLVPRAAEFSAGLLLLFRRAVLTGITPAGTPPPAFHLMQNYPNPFNPGSDIRFEIAAAGHVRLSVFDLLGHEVALLLDEDRSAGAFSVRFDAGKLPAGAYFYRLASGGRTETRRMLLIR